MTHSALQPSIVSPVSSTEEVNTKALVLADTKEEKDLQVNTKALVLADTKEEEDLQVFDEREILQPGEKQAGLQVQEQHAHTRGKAEVGKLDERSKKALVLQDTNEEKARRDHELIPDESLLEASSQTQCGGSGLGGGEIVCNACRLVPENEDAPTSIPPFHLSDLSSDLTRNDPCSGNECRGPVSAETKDHGKDTNLACRYRANLASFPEGQAEKAKFVKQIQKARDAGRKKIQEENQAREEKKQSGKKRPTIADDTCKQGFMQMQKCDHPCFLKKEKDNLVMSKKVCSFPQNDEEEEIAERQANEKNEMACNKKEPDACDLPCFVGIKKVKRKARSGREIDGYEEICSYPKNDQQEQRAQKQAKDNDIIQLNNLLRSVSCETFEYQKLLSKVVKSFEKNLLEAVAGKLPLVTPDFLSNITLKSAPGTLERKYMLSRDFSYFKSAAIESGCILEIKLKDTFLPNGLSGDSPDNVPSEVRERLQMVVDEANDMIVKDKAFCGRKVEKAVCDATKA